MKRRNLLTIGSGIIIGSLYTYKNNTTVSSNINIDSTEISEDLLGSPLKLQFSRFEIDATQISKSHPLNIKVFARIQKENDFISIFSTEKSVSESTGVNEIDIEDVSLESLNIYDYLSEEGDKITLDLKIEINHENIDENITEDSIQIKVSEPKIYTKNITISNNVNEAINDIPVDIRISAESELNENFSNIEFYNGDTKLPHWMESFEENNEAKFWVQINKLDANEELTITAKYGSSITENQSNGLETFKFFDNFSSDSIREHWNDLNSGINQSNDNLRITKGNLRTNRIVNPEKFIVESKHIYESDGIIDSDSSGLMIGEPDHSGSNSNSNANVLFIINSGDDISGWAGDGTEDSYNLCSGQNITSINTDESKIYGISFDKNSEEINYHINYENELTCFGNLTSEVQYFVIGIGDFDLTSNSDTSNINYDWVRMRKYVEPMPTQKEN